MKEIICRPCKERSNWEIVNPSGMVLEKHYKTEEECMCAAKKLKEEYGSETIIVKKDKKK